MQIFNEGIHYSFVASVAAMLIFDYSLCYQESVPKLGKKEAAAAVTYSAEEKAAMAKEIKQRLYALFAVLRCYFLLVLISSEWYSHFHSLRETSLIHRQSLLEIWQAVNFSLLLHWTPIIMMIFGSLFKKR